MELQHFLRNTGTPERLTALYGIMVKPHGKYPNLILCKYSQIDSPMGERIVQESRGCILDSANNWEVVARPYDKFFNYEEGHAAQIDWNTAKVFEKCDGSLCTLYHYNDEWLVATSGSPDASGNVNDFGFSFNDLFWQVWQEKQYQLPTDTSKCYMFELMTPYNRIVVQHSKNNLLLHGVRDRNGVEYCPEEAAKSHGWHCVPSFALNTLDGVVEASKALKGIECEGYVVTDSFFKRIKIKCPQYIAIHHLKSSFSQRRMTEIILCGESTEILSYFEEFRPLHDEILSKYNLLLSEIETVYSNIKDIENQKEFASYATKYKFQGILFTMRKCNIDCKKCLINMNIKNVMELLEIKEGVLVIEDV